MGGLDWWFGGVNPALLDAWGRDPNFLNHQTKASRPGDSGFSQRPRSQFPAEGWNALVATATVLDVTRLRLATAPGVGWFHFSFPSKQGSLNFPLWF